MHPQTQSKLSVGALSSQAYELKGRNDQARAEYERFLQVWKDADADVPEIFMAKKRLSG